MSAVTLGCPFNGCSFSAVDKHPQADPATGCFQDCQQHGTDFVLPQLEMEKAFVR
jgi:hypothetical protein